jgi:DNA-binding CsgD family transcriptional regulator
LSIDPARRAQRMLAAAQVNVLAGAFEAALGLLATAQPGLSDELARARVDLCRGQIAFASGVGGDAPGLLLKAAERLGAVDVKLARETYLEAWGAAHYVGDLVRPGGMLAVSRPARAAPRPAHFPRPSDLLLDAFAALIADGRAAAAPMLRQAVGAFAGTEVSAEEGLRWGWLFPVAAAVVWEDATWQAIAVRQVQFTRDAGALARLPFELTALAGLVAWFGDFATAASLIAEGDLVAEATGTLYPPISAMLLAGLRGREAEVVPLIEATITSATAGGQGIAVQTACWVAAMLYNGLGQYEEALVWAERASGDTPELYLSPWALVELTEAAARSGRAQLAAEVVERLAVATQAGGTDWALGIEARSRALCSEGEAADALYRDAIDRLRRTRFRTELARAHLLYGEWLRRWNRRVDAREQLRIAHQMFDGIGMEAFAQRAERELLATGVHARKRTVETLDQLTAQELQIARMARDGLSNPEIGTRLFITPRTVKYHLQKVFTKLDINSRSQLARRLPAGEADTPVR